jgi:KDO2-lipid IV(A) lauroyltransferase
MEKEFMGWVILPLLYLFSNFFFWLPRAVQMGMGAGLGTVLDLLHFRAEVVDQNLSFAYPGTSAAEVEVKRDIRKQSYREFGNLILEICFLFGPLRKFTFNQVDVIGLENWHAANHLGKGVIFLSSHAGNWEVMAATGGLLAKIDLMLVTKHLKPEWLHQAIEKGRLKCGVKATYEPKTSRDIIKHLKNKGTVGFVLDQYAGAPVGVRVPLFGKPVGTSLVVATFAKRTGAPVVPVLNYRRPDGRWTVHVLPALTWLSPRDDLAQGASAAHYELAANTALYAATLEKHILEHPAQWLWIHRRFKGDLSPLREGEWHSPRLRT